MAINSRLMVAHDSDPRKKGILNRIHYVIALSLSMDMNRNEMIDGTSERSTCSICLNEKQISL